MFLKLNKAMEQKYTWLFFVKNCDPMNKVGPYKDCFFTFARTLTTPTPFALFDNIHGHLTMKIYISWLRPMQYNSGCNTDIPGVHLTFIASAVILKGNVVIK
jgi:hypothetical protein